MTTDDFLKRLPRHDISLTLEHNPHKAYYQTVEQYVEQYAREYDHWDTFVSESERDAAIATGELWELHWYPETPVGFHTLMASTLEALLEGARGWVG